MHKLLIGLSRGGFYYFSDQAGSNILITVDIARLTDEIDLPKKVKHCFQIGAFFNHVRVGVIGKSGGVRKHVANC